MENEVQNILDSVGAMAEVLATFHKALLGNGFDDEQALYLTSDYMKVVFGK